MESELLYFLALIFLYLSDLQNQVLSEPGPLGGKQPLFAHLLLTAIGDVLRAPTGTS